MEDGKWIKLKCRGEELIYPRPDNLVTLGDKTHFEKGENVCIAYNTTSPIYRVNGIIRLLKARQSQGDRYYEKENVLVSDCYALNDGIIHYKEDKYGYISVYIGDKEYQYSPESMYYFPDGATVHKFDRICSGVVNMEHVVSEMKDLNDIYLIFRKQMYSLAEDADDFLKTGVTSLGSFQEEIIEFLFAGVISIKRDMKTQAIKDIEYEGTHNTITKGESFYTALSYGYSSKVVKRAMKGEVNLSGDVIRKVVLLHKVIDNNMNCWKRYSSDIKSAGMRDTFFNDYGYYKMI